MIFQPGFHFHPTKISEPQSNSFEFVLIKVGLLSTKVQFGFQKY